MARFVVQTIQVEASSGKTCDKNPCPLSICWRYQPNVYGYDFDVGGEPKKAAEL